MALTPRLGSGRLPVLRHMWKEDLEQETLSWPMEVEDSLNPPTSGQSDAINHCLCTGDQ